MVTMTLLKIDNENKIVYFHCLPEGKEEESFDLGLDPYNKKIISNTLGKRNSYVIHAAYKIYECYTEKGKIPHNAVSVWN